MYRPLRCRTWFTLKRFVERMEDIRVRTAGTTDRERHFPRKCRRLVKILTGLRVVGRAALAS